MIQSNLNRTTYRCASLDRDVTLIELSYKAQMQMMAASQEGRIGDVGAIMVKYGVEEFSDMSADEIAEGFSAEVILELNNAVSDFSGVEEDYEKKSEPSQD